MWFHMIDTKGEGMSKHITAVKCKDSWLVQIIDVRIVLTEGDVHKLVRENGLKVQIHSIGDGVEGRNESIYAE